MHFINKDLCCSYNLSFNQQQKKKVYSNSIIFLEKIGRIILGKNKYLRLGVLLRNWIKYPNSVINIKYIKLIKYCSFRCNILLNYDILYSPL